MNVQIGLLYAYAFTFESNRFESPYETYDSRLNVLSPERRIVVTFAEGQISTPP